VLSLLVNQKNNKNNNKIKTLEGRSEGGFGVSGPLSDSTKTIEASCRNKNNSE
jgi:hypothetical protein